VAPITVALRLRSGCNNLTVPEYIECLAPGDPANIEAELMHWGIDCKAFRFGSGHEALCFPAQWTAPVNQFHYMFCHEDIKDSEGIFLHTSNLSLDDLGLMQILYQFGYCRAAILDKEEILPQVFRVLFLDVVQQPTTEPGRIKKPLPWPAPSHHGRLNRPFFDPGRHLEGDKDFLIRLGITMIDIDAFFKSGDDILCRDPTGLELPETTKQVMLISDTTDLALFDRLIIYTDGSSIPLHRHRPAAWNEENGNGDTWAYVVLGERFVDQQQVVEVIGWLTHPVRYDPHCPSFLGSTYVGSLGAEREAMTWAALWRLAQNVDTPTLFRTDSWTTAMQAQGQIGTADVEASFTSLRSCFQALEVALPNRLQVEHTPGHCGDPYNDFADWLAREERSRSFYGKRQAISLDLWRPFLPYMWMLFSQTDGLPSWSSQGFHVPPPQLPSPLATPVCEETTLISDLAAKIDISLASANIGSMYNGEWGHAGKLDYLRTQFKLLCLNFLGLQEARTPELFSRTDRILRFASGAHHGHHSIELCVNLEQAYAVTDDGPIFFAPHHFVVVHKDHRCLLVHVVTEWVDFWILVAHAPQSGVPLSERQMWWDHLMQITAACPQTARLFALLDANAGPGSADHVSVFRTIGGHTSSTPLLRTFLQEGNLCLPCTSSCHEGTHTTWITPDGLSEHMIDYIAIPQNCLSNCSISRVLDEFDLGNSHHDHSAIALQLQWQELRQSHSAKKDSSKPHIDFSIVQNSHVEQALGDYVVPAWTENIEDQVSQFNGHLLARLQNLCPHAKHRPKKPCIDEATWNLRTQKLIARRGLRQLARHHRLELLRACFQSWTSQPGYDKDRFWHYGRWLQCANVKLLARHHTSAAQLKAKLRARKTAYLKQAFENLPTDAPASSILHELKKIVGSTNLKAIKQQTLPLIKDSTGQPCISPSHALDTWIQFFQNMEGGRRVDKQEQHQLWVQNLKKFQATSLDLKITDVPSLVELEAAFRHVKPQKATGPDLIDAKICASSPTIVARKTYSQLLKLYTHGQESLLHKGGRLQPIWKQKGPRDACSAYRSVLISSHVGKSLHRCLLLHSADVFEHYLQLQQTGGMRGISVTLGVHQARAYLRTRLSQHQCVGLLFLDLTEAFYRIVRQLALGGLPDDEAIAAVGNRLQLGPDLLHALHQHLDDRPAVVQAGLSPQLQKVLQALHTDTHFYVGVQQDACRTTLGTRPGDCFADIVFSFLWARLLHRLEQIMQESNILDGFPDEEGLRIPDAEAAVCGTKSFLGPTWMDDTCIAFAKDSPSSLERAAGQVGGALLGLCEEFATSPNLAKGKTELMLVFQGKGANSAKLKYYGPCSPQTFPIILEGGVKHLSVVSSYTHLGCTIHHRGDLRREVRRRLSIAHAAFNRHRRLLFQNRCLDLTRRRELFRTLILSKLLYGAESWTLRDGKDKHYLHSAMMRLYNRLLPVQSKPRSDATIMAETGLPDPAVLLRICRLRHLGQLYRTGRSTSWGLFNDDQAWQDLIWSDLFWMWQQLKNSSKLPDPKQGFQQWEYLMKHHPGFWKRLIRRAGDHDGGQKRNEHVVAGFHGEFLETLHSHGRLWHDAPRPEAASVEQVHACMMCEKRFLSRGGCGAHLFRAHGHVNPVRHLFATSQCGACMKEYHTFAKLKTHLLQVTTCRQTLQANRLRWQPAPGAGSQINASMEATHDGLLPPLKVHGPLPELPPGRADEDFDQDLLEQIFLDILDAMTIEECEMMIRNATHARAISWYTFQATLTRFLDIFMEEDAAVLHVPGDSLRGLLQKLMDSNAWPFLAADGRDKNSPWHQEIEIQEQHCLREIEEQRNRAPVLRPARGFARERYILHLFAGRRRQGDFQFFVDGLTDLHGTFFIQVISVDIVIDRRWGDLSNSDTRRFWISAILDHQIVALLGGPPCETWSRARGRQLSPEDPLQRSGPRVVRTLEEVWGLSSLSLRELAQVTIGNVLMGFQLVAMAALACTGGIAVVEHPAESPNPEEASIWRTPIMQLLLALPECESFTLAQGLWGAQSSKPTTLGVLNAPQLKLELHKGRITTEVPKGSSIGKDTSGNWATARLKEYPPGLCLALARGFLKAIGDLPEDPAQQVSLRNREIFGPLVCTSYGHAYGPDFAG